MVLFKGIFGLLLNLLVLNHGCSQSLQEEELTICWQEGRKLDWADFQGTPDTVITYLGTPAYAGTAASIHYSLTKLDSVVVKVSVEFFKNRSWSTDTLSLSGLQHEQLHFDIAELYGRKIRKKIRELNAIGEQDISVFSSEANNLLKERREVNHEYDLRTGHGVVDIKQQEWNEKIAKELQELEAYATSAEDCETNLE